MHESMRDGSHLLSVAGLWPQKKRIYDAEESTDRESRGVIHKRMSKCGSSAWLAVATAGVAQAHGQSLRQQCGSVNSGRNARRKSGRAHA